MTGPILGIVLAGGASRRFGADKLAADLDGRPLLHHALEAIGAVADRLVVVIAPDAPIPPLPETLTRRISIARDAGRHEGPLAGLAAGLGSDAAAGSEIALAVGGDMPALVRAVLRLLVERLAADAVVVAMTLDASPVAPLPVALRIDPARLAAASCLAAGWRSLRSLLDAVPAATVATTDWRSLDPDGRTLRDVDTPADLVLGAE